MEKNYSRSGEAEAIILIKAAPHIGEKHGETVCCAAIDIHGNWLRLYPISFRDLDENKKFGRWDRIKFKWRLPKDDSRSESRRVDQNSIEVVGTLKPSEREKFLANSVVTSLTNERKAGRSLALLRAKILNFKIELKSKDDHQKEIEKFAELRRQSDIFTKVPIVPYEPCLYRFKYKYQTDDGEREGTCQDWELEATFFNWQKRYGTETALAEIQRIFGEEYPAKGMVLAMGTHSQYPDTWLINGVIRLNENNQSALF
ncbi:MAG: hypothetical protein WA138_11880 [Parvibaculum sp.]